MLFFASILALLLIMPIAAASSLPENAKLHLAPISDTYILKDCSTCKMFNESELRVGYVAKRVRLNYYAAVKYKIVITNRSNALLKFNLSKIPPGAKIKVARLWLYIKKLPVKSLTLYLYVLKEKYDDSLVTWKYRTKDKLWKVPGGFGEPDYTDRVTVDERASIGSSVGFLVTKYVSRVLNGEIEDYGLLILPNIEKLSLRDFSGGSNSLNMYVDFFSYEGSKRELKTRYRPDLYVEFVKPTAMLSLSTQKLVLDRGASASLNISESGTYSGAVKLGYRVVKAPGLKVGPLQVNIRKFVEKPGFSTSVDISAKKNAMPGEYVIEFYPITPGYGSDVVYYGKKNLTVIVKGEEKTSSPTSTITTQESTTKTETNTQGESTSMTLTTSIPTVTTLPSTTTSRQQASSTTSTLVLTTSASTTTRKTELLSTDMLIGVLGVVIVALLLVVILLKRRSS